MKQMLIGMTLFLCVVPKSFSQGNTEYTGGYKVSFNEDGTKYLRIIAWGQFWAQYFDDVPEDAMPPRQPGEPVAPIANVPPTDPPVH